MANQPAETPQNANRPEPKKLRMVGWYHPPQLAQTAVEVAISSIFGRHSDHRLVEAMASGEDDQEFYDYTYEYTDDGKELCQPNKEKKRKSIWIDYVGDVGDGWNSTYAIAYYLAGPRSFKYMDGNTTYDTTKTQRGDILIFGGDEVYPTASRESYKERLVTPYETALRRTDPPSPHVFAIPGNHDWYDSLVAFTRLFTARPWFAGWRTRQSRSYFALKLPHNWWLLGTDVQLGSDIDAPQVKYFENLSRYMSQEEANTGKPASIILCHAEPHWIRAWQYEGVDPNYNESNLKLLEKRLGKDVAIFIAGDLHHYRRHEARDQSTQKITAGGGGAFLHPTHVGRRGKRFDTIYELELSQENLTPDDIKALPESQIFELKACFPTEEESSRACWHNLAFPFFWLMGNASWTLGLVTAALYLLLMLPIVFIVDDLKLKGRADPISYVTYTAIDSIVHSPLTMLLLLATIIGFWLFTDSHSKLQRFIGGALHAIGQIGAAFLIAAGSVALVAYISTPGWVWRIPWFGDFDFPFDTRKLLAVLLILLGGFLAGTFIMGLYVLISMNIFGRHGNEAFSSLGIEDWKNFLRMQIDENGNLTIYPIGIRRVPRKWDYRPNESPEMIPNDPKATKPSLIEPPIFMEKRAGTDTGVLTRPLKSQA